MRRRIAVRQAVKGWLWDLSETDWEEGLSLLKAYAEHKGDARVPTHHKEGEFNLGTWVNSRRSEYKKDKLSPERIKALQAVEGWLWKVRSVR